MLTLSLLFILTASLIRSIPSRVEVWVVSTVVASATSGNVHPDSSNDTDSYSVGEQEQDDVS